MPDIASIKTAVATLPSGPPLVVAITSGTSGIGSYIAKVLAQTYSKQGSKLRVYIIGRSASRGETIIEDCKQTSPGSEWRFLKVDDLALIGDVDRVCGEITKMEEADSFAGSPVRLDLLYMTHGYPIFSERKTTSEGLDAFISMHYYSRIRFITNLIPLLTASPFAGRAVSVYAGYMEDKTAAPDLPIGTPPDSVYGISSVRKHSSFMNAFIFEEFAEKYRGKLALTHIFPGLVDGPAFLNKENPLWWRLAWRVMKPLAKMGMTSAEDCGLTMVYLATSTFPAKPTAGGSSSEGDVTKSTTGEAGGGSYALGAKADTKQGDGGVSYKSMRSDAGMGKKVWDHTMEVIEGAKKKSERQ